MDHEAGTLHFGVEDGALQHALAGFPVGAAMRPYAKVAQPTKSRILNKKLPSKNRKGWSVVHVPPPHVTSGNQIFRKCNADGLLPSTRCRGHRPYRRDSWLGRLTHSPHVTLQ